MTRLSSLILTVAIAATPLAAPAARRQTRTTVPGLLHRAASEPHRAAVRTLVEAEQRAIREKDGNRRRKAILSVVQTAHSLVQKWLESGVKDKDLPVSLLRVLALQEKHAPRSPAVFRTLIVLGWAYRERDRDAARRYLERALGIGEAQASPDGLGPLLVVLGNVATECNDPAAAKRYYLRGLDYLQRTKPDSGVLVSTLNALGTLLYAEGDLAAAREHLQRALPMAEKLADSSSLAAILHNLGNVAGDQNDLAEAKRHYLRALQIWEQTNPDSKDVANTLDALGTALRLQGDLPSAREHFERERVIAEKLGDRSVVAGSLNSLGTVAYTLGELGAAKQYFERSLAIRAELSPHSEEVAECLTNLGGVNTSSGELAAASRCFEQSLAIHESLTKPKGSASPAVGLNLNNLAVVAFKQGDLRRAADYSQRARWHFQQLSAAGREFPLEQARCLGSLGDIARTRKQWAEAQGYYEEALRLCERAVPDSLESAHCLQDLGVLAFARGDLEAAKSYYQRALALREKLAPESLDMAASLHGMGMVARAERDLLAASGYFQRALRIKERLTPNSLELVPTLTNLADGLDEAGSPREAVQTFRRALEILDAQAPESLMAATVLRGLARSSLSLEPGAAVKTYLERADRLDARLNEAGGLVAEGKTVSLPVIRLFAPTEQGEVRGPEVTLRLVFVSPLPLARYRLWVNGRSLGDQGFQLPTTDEKGRLLDKGRLLEKGDRLDDGRVFERGRLLEKGEEREGLARDLPGDLAALVKLPQYTHVLEIQHTIPLDDIDGQFVRISGLVETVGGSISERRVLSIRRPEVEQQRGSLRVLTIGIGDYQNLPKLKFAPADAIALAGVLQAQSGLEDDHRLYRGSTIVSRTDADASLERIRSDLDRLVAETQPADTVIVALSGHGITKGDRTWFAPVRFDPENPGGTGLAWNEVLAKLQEVRKVARTVWLLADCCRAAPGLRRPESGSRKDQVVAASTRELKQGLDEGGNLIVVTASSENQPSYESEALEHGIFTFAWLEALRGQAPDLVYEDTPRGRVLTLSRLQFWLDTSVIRHARAAGVRQNIEFPRLEGSFSPSTPLFVPVGR